MATQEELKRIAAQKAVEFVPEDEYIGIGTGTTVNCFIEALAASGKKIKGAVSTSKETSAQLAKYNIPEVTLSDVVLPFLSVTSYVTFTLAELSLL